MRFLSLFLIFSLALCYSGAYSFANLHADSAKGVGSHCDMTNHNAADATDESQVSIQNASAVDLENSQCCYEGLTNSAIENNIGNKALDVLYLLDFPTSLDTGNSKSIDSTFTKSIHDPPDIYLSVSSFLL